MEPWWWIVALVLPLALLAAGALALLRPLREREARLAELQQQLGGLDRRLQQARQEERRLFESGPVIVLGLDGVPPYRLQHATPNLQRARGSAPGEVLSGRPLAELLHPDDAAPFALTAAQAMAQPSQRVQREVRLRHEGGSWRWHLLQLCAERDGEAALRGYLVGIDALKQAESQAAARRRDLEELVLKMSASQRFLQSLHQLGEQLALCTQERRFGEIVALAGPELFPRWDGALTFADASGAMTVAARWGTFEAPRPGRQTDCWALRRGRLHASSASGAVRNPVCRHYGDGELPDGVTQALCVPLVAPGGRPGALHLTSRDTLGEEQVRAAGWGAEAVAETLKLALGNLRLRLSLHEQAVRDWLTGLHNRRHFDEALQAEIDRARRGGEPLTLALLDIDHFKTFNDSFGHEAGDEVLKAVAAELRGFVRSYDLACRVGGEELALLMPRATIDESCARLDRLRERIAELSLHIGGVVLPSVTVSMGVAGLEDGASADLLHRADLALYAAKHGGRNRVARWEPTLEQQSADVATALPADAALDGEPRRRRRDEEF